MESFLERLTKNKANLSVGVSTLWSVVLQEVRMTPPCLLVSVWSPSGVVALLVILSGFTLILPQSCLTQVITFMEYLGRLQLHFVSMDEIHSIWSVYFFWTGVILPPAQDNCQCLETFFVVTFLGEEVNAIGIQRKSPEMPCGALQRTGQPCTARSYLALNSVVLRLRNLSIYEYSKCLQKELVGLELG